jgi:NAD+ diphosphatase
MTHVNMFAGSPLDRAANHRSDKAWLAEQRERADTRFLAMWQLRALMEVGEPLRIAWRTIDEVRPFAEEGGTEIFLGMLDGQAHFAVDVSLAGPKKADAPFKEQGKWIDVRSAASSGLAEEAAILAQARSMLDWHARHGFCAVCGVPSAMHDAGYTRKCTSEDCGAMHFPRTDPVVIMLVLDGDNCLLGRQKIFAPLSYSALAGFVEPGESIEEAVRREVHEEVGIVLGDVRYISSQPWPFPSSLMIGCIGEAKTTEIVLDPNELEEARWFTRDQVAEMVENWADQSKLRTPAPLAIAHQLVRAWLRGE